MAIGAGFMEFAQGFNQTVRGWGNEAAGTVSGLWNSATGDESGAVAGAIQDQEGNEQAARGENLMGDGISEMFGLVDHGDQAAPSPHDGMY
jgi:hypothetical protein